MRVLFYLVSRLGSLVYLMAQPQVPRWVKMLPLLGLLYVIWPRDLLFDFPPGIGHIDDLIVVMGLLNLFFYLAQRYVVRPPADPDDGKTVEAKFHVVEPQEGESIDDSQQGTPGQSA